MAIIQVQLAMLGCGIELWTTVDCLCELVVEIVLQMTVAEDSWQGVAPS